MVSTTYSGAEVPHLAVGRQDCQLQEKKYCHFVEHRYH